MPCRISNRFLPLPVTYLLCLQHIPLQHKHRPATGWKSQSEPYAGFIAALYIIAVPILAIFLKKKTSVTAMTGIIIAIIGFYFLIYGKSGLSE